MLDVADILGLGNLAVDKLADSLELDILVGILAAGRLVGSLEPDILAVVVGSFAALGSSVARWLSSHGNLFFYSLIVGDLDLYVDVLSALFDGILWVDCDLLVDDYSFQTVLLLVVFSVDTDWAVFDHILVGHIEKWHYS